MANPLVVAIWPLLCLIRVPWLRRWLISGLPLLSLIRIVSGREEKKKNKPNGLIGELIRQWPVLATLNVIYAVASTSWLLYSVFVCLCYPAIFITCLARFEVVGDWTRRQMRRLLKHLHFIQDMVAFFDIPALEIDTEVEGLMVLRGITFSLSTLSFVVHGVEVGIRLSEDMELAIQTDEVSVKLFREIKVGHCYANLKGGEYEMTFGHLASSTHDGHGRVLFESDTPLLTAASGRKEKDLSGMKEDMTRGAAPKDSTPKDGFEDMQKITSDNDDAMKRYRETLEHIEKTSTISQCRAQVQNRIHMDKADGENANEVSQNSIRAAICSQLHQKPSVPHPPKRSIKVTTLKNLSSKRTQTTLHRMPLLLRVLLTPLSHFHPIHIASVTATATGQWIDSLLIAKIFKDYGKSDSETQTLKKRVSAWLSDANFAVELGAISATGRVPLVPSYDIICDIDIADVLAYRSLPKQLHLQQVIRLGGADATFNVPSFLLPHHEHLLPPRPTCQEAAKLVTHAKEADGKPKKVQAEHTLERVIKDEANVHISAHARLPACFDQELLDFVAALVKATKVVEMEKDKEHHHHDHGLVESSEGEDSSGSGSTAAPSGHSFTHRLSHMNHSVKDSVKDGMKKAAIGGIVNDKWIAKMVGKITRKLEAVQGDLGYSGDIPVPLDVYRKDNKGPELAREGKKILP